VSEAARILIVDDEKALATALARTLRSEGYLTAEAFSGPEALRLLREAAVAPESAFHVLVTDLMMPDMDGIMLLRASQAIDVNLASVVMSGRGTIDTAVEAMKCGALDFILKPFNLTVIAPVLQRVLAVRRLRMDNAALLQSLTERTVELQDANRALAAANTELDAFAHSASHDLRTPLHAIVGFAELLVQEKAGPLNAKQKEYLTDILNGGRRLESITTELLRFARLGREPLQKQRVDICELVYEVLDELRATEPGRELDIRVGELPPGMADRAFVRQVFVNLLSNAFKFTRQVPHPVIEVRGWRDHGFTSYTVRDNGAGFEMASADKLFRLFQRLHRIEDFDGTGVGLSLVKRIVERHGGRISAEAQPGKGAIFTFTLPA
jgi:two-component system sensor histidine kinase/response regulator